MEPKTTIYSSISTPLLFKALGLYEKLGYQMLDVPLLVEPVVSAHTKPKSRRDNYHTQDLCYVGSAEQSFLQLIKNKKIEPGLYQAITPCIRDEEKLDETHFLVFLKIELIHIGNKNYQKILSDAQNVMKCLGVSTTLIKTKMGHDLYWNDIELGSYGTNSFEGMNYSYGTGLAEPRFSMCKQKS